MTVREGAQGRARNVRILAAGGTISMTGEADSSGESGATPELDAEALVAGIPSLAEHDGLEAHDASPTCRAPT